VCKFLGTPAESFDFQEIIYEKKGDTPPLLEYKSGVVGGMSSIT